jgi:RNA polymerase sigma-70 factor (ECF subfamily)
MPARSPQDSAFDVEQWIAGARAGSSESLGQLAERCRRYLLLIANQEQNSAWLGKRGASDLVQETLLTAQQVFGRFEGNSEGELRLWLRRILLHKLAHADRSYRQTAARNVHRERPIDDISSVDERPATVDAALTPCRNAIAREQAAAIERALERLPDHYREIVLLRSFERQTFVEIGERLNLSADAVRKTWCQAIKRLRREWDAER